LVGFGDIIRSILEAIRQNLCKFCKYDFEHGDTNHVLGVPVFRLGCWQLAKKRHSK
jgi:hypothetical protein